MSTPIYVPKRASARTERERLLADIAELEQRLAEQEQRSEISADPSYARAAYRTRQDLKRARERLDMFDRKQRDLDERRDSGETTSARKSTTKAAEKFEKTLQAAADAARELKESATDLANALAVKDAGEWPSRNAVDVATRARVIDVLGRVAGIKLDGYGTQSTGSLAERFGSTLQEELKQ